ncbi:Alpha/Beta hydrolase protein [Mrakia frigida]|uniref:lipase family protein n=1 Tax=Mrakia frigida TaxID=29902 RepID=UPI003FCC144B
MANLTVKQIGALLKIDTYENALTWAHHSEAEATRKYQILSNGQLINTRTLLELFGLYLPNLFVAVEVGETAGNMMKALVGSAVVLLGQVPAFPPLSRFIREQKDRRRVPNFAIVHLASRVPPVDFIYQGMDMPGQQGGYTGFNALVTFSHHLEFTLRAVRFSCNDKLVWKASTTSLPFKGLLNTPTNPQKLSLSFDQHRLEFFQAQSDPRLRRQTQQFKTLLNQCMGGLSDIADFCNGSRVASKVETLSSQWLRVWKDCAGKGGASKCAKVSDEDGMMACGRCHSVRYCGAGNRGGVGSSALISTVSTPDHLISRISSGSVTALSSAARNQLGAYAQFAGAAYCDSVTVGGKWACGSGGCDASKGVTLLAWGGNDNDIPGWYVLWSGAEQSLVVAHQGTNFLSIMSVLNNVAFLPTNFDTKLFPGVPSNVLAHSGWLRTHALTAAPILAAVKKGMTTYNTNKVLVVGHSLGASLGVLESLYLKLQIPSIQLKSRQFASPRVGTSLFATYFATVVPDHIHVTRGNDPVPHLPPLAFGFEHVAGEVFIKPYTNNFVACSGRENINCGLGALLTNVIDHIGPYNGVNLGLCYS